MKKNVLVTLADRKYLTQAKQLFAGAYFNAGWSGDFLLLAHGVPEKYLIWFKKRGIIVKKCKPLSNIIKSPKVSTGKLYLFTEEIKKWNKVIYLDTDILIRGSLESLMNNNGYAVTPDLDRQPLIYQFTISNINEWLIFKRIKKYLKKNYNLINPSFNCGVIAFSTEIIKKNTFKQLIKILKITKDISVRSGEQTAQNLYFYKKWKKLPIVYNLPAPLYSSKYKIKPRNIKGIILHFGSDKLIDKPWNPNNPFFKEWLKNYLKADKINRKITIIPKEIWSMHQIWLYDSYLTLRRFIYSPFNNQSVKIEFLLKIIKFELELKYPKIYIFLKKFKKKVIKI